MVISDAKMERFTEKNVHFFVQGIFIDLCLTAQVYIISTFSIKNKKNQEVVM